MRFRHEPETSDVLSDDVGATPPMVRTPCKRQGLRCGGTSSLVSPPLRSLSRPRLEPHSEPCVQHRESAGGHYAIRLRTRPGDNLNLEMQGKTTA